jgi:hypothetical protein
MATQLSKPVFLKKTEQRFSVGFLTQAAQLPGKALAVAVALSTVAGNSNSPKVIFGQCPRKQKAQPVRAGLGA